MGICVQQGMYLVSISILVLLFFTGEQSDLYYKCITHFYTTAKILIFRRILLSRWRRLRRRRPNTFRFRTLTLVKVNRNL